MKRILDRTKCSEGSSTHLLVAVTRVWMHARIETRTGQAKAVTQILKGPKRMMRAVRRGAWTSLAMCACLAFAQPQVAPVPQPAIQSIASVPIAVQFNLGLFSKRLLQSGSERVALTGTLNLQGTAVKATITMELPRKLNLSLENGVEIGFDGAKPWVKGSQVSPTQIDLIQTFLDDSPEVMFYDLAQQALVTRPIVRHAVTVPGGGAASLVDVVAVLGPVLSRGAQQRYTREAVFGSQSLYLDEVRYIGGAVSPNASVSVARSNWQIINGVPVPMTITRSLSGSVVAQFEATAAAVSAAVNDGLFSPK